MKTFTQYNQILKNTNYFYLWLGQLLSNTGTGFTNTVLVMHLAAKFQSGKIISTLLLMSVLPALLLGPLSGVFTDRYDKRKIMILADITRAFLVFSIPFTQNLYLIYAAVFLISTCTTFFTPAHIGTVSAIVEKENLITAHSLSSITRSLCSFILGSSLGAAIYTLFGTITVFSIDSITYIVSAIMIFLLKYNQNHAAKSQPNKTKPDPILSEIRDGFSYIKKDKTILLSILALTLLMLTGGAVNVLMIFVTKHNYISQSAYGYILSANGIGALAGSLLVNEYKEKLLNLKSVLTFFIIMGISNFAFALNHILILGLLLFIINGFCNQFITIPLMTIIQTKTNQDMIGRVVSTQNTLITIASTLSMMIAGALMDIYNANLLFLITASILVINGTIGLIIHIKPKTKQHHFKM